MVLIFYKYERYLSLYSHFIYKKKIKKIEKIILLFKLFFAFINQININYLNQTWAPSFCSSEKLKQCDKKRQTEIF